MSTNFSTYAIGQQVGIYYDLANPTQGYIDSILFLYGIGLFLITFGIIIILISLVSFKKTANNPMFDLTKLGQNDPKLTSALKVIQEKIIKRE